MSSFEDGTYFITGAGGFIGRRLCELLVERDASVVGLVRRKGTGSDRLKMRYVQGDLANPAQWIAELRHADYIIHCAGNARFGNGADYQAANVETTRTLVAAIRSDGQRLKRFVFVSSVGAVDREPSDDCEMPLDEGSACWATSDYGRSKVAGESLTKTSGLPFCIIRPALVVGSEMRFDSHFSVFADWALRGHPLSRIGWPGRFSVVGVDDLCEAILICATHKDALNRTFMCGGNSISLLEYFNLIEERHRLPLGRLRAVAGKARASLPFKLKSMLFPALVVNDAALKALGWRAKLSATEALAPVIARERARLDSRVPPPIGQTVVTGAASGLGMALAEALAPIRDNVLLVDRDGRGLSQLASRFPNARCELTDLADPNAWEALVQSENWRAHPVVELYACAGTGRKCKFDEDSVELQLNILRVNLLSRMRLVHASIADMARLQFGRIILIASSSAFQPLPLMTAYAASNAALLSFGEGIGFEVASRGIQVLTVCPGGMATNFQERANVKRNPNEMLMAPTEVAARIMQSTACGPMTLVISARAKVMEIAGRILPRRLSVALWGRLMGSLR